MTATVTPFPTPTRPQDPALLADLAELRQLGMEVARTAAHLARIENATLDTLEAETARAAQALIDPPDLTAVLNAGHQADACQAEREAAIVRVATITECFQKAARAVRRTAALQARLASGRPFPDVPSPGSSPQDRSGQPASNTRRTPGTDPAEYPDRPETGDELGHRTGDELLTAIRRDLAGYPEDLTRLPELLPFVLPAPIPGAPPPTPLSQSAQPVPLPAPDT